MPRQPAPRRLVIDADVARAAGRPSSQDPTSMTCRSFLTCLHDETRHMAALSDELAREWDGHASHYATRWRALMRSRGRLVEVGPVHDPELRRALTQHAETDAQRTRVLKDAHLVETARRADRVVCSRDDRVRNDLRELARSVSQLARVVWVNPTRPDEEPIRWLRTGAAHDGWRRLDHGID
jgi:hypothetical protein